MQVKRGRRCRQGVCLGTLCTLNQPLLVKFVVGGPIYSPFNQGECELLSNITLKLCHTNLLRICDADSH